MRWTVLGLGVLLELLAPSARAEEIQVEGALRYNSEDEPGRLEVRSPVTGEWNEIAKIEDHAWSGCTLEETSGVLSFVCDGREVASLDLETGRLRASAVGFEVFNRGRDLVLRILDSDHIKSVAARERPLPDLNPADLVLTRWPGRTELEMGWWVKVDPQAPPVWIPTELRILHSHHGEGRLVLEKDLQLDINYLYFNWGHGKAKLGEFESLGHPPGGSEANAGSFTLDQGRLLPFPRKGSRSWILDLSMLRGSAGGRVVREELEVDGRPGNDLGRGWLLNSNTDTLGFLNDGRPPSEKDSGVIVFRRKGRIIWDPASGAIFLKTEDQTPEEILIGVSRTASDPDQKLFRVDWIVRTHQINRVVDLIQVERTQGWLEDVAAEVASVRLEEVDPKEREEYLQVWPGLVPIRDALRKVVRSLAEGADLDPEATWTQIEGLFFAIMRTIWVENRTVAFAYGRETVLVHAWEQLAEEWAKGEGADPGQLEYWSRVARNAFLQGLVVRGQGIPGNAKRYTQLSFARAVAITTVGAYLLWSVLMSVGNESIAEFVRPGSLKFLAGGLSIGGILRFLGRSGARHEVANQWSEWDRQDQRQGVAGRPLYPSVDRLVLNLADSIRRAHPDLQALILGAECAEVLEGGS